MAISIRVKDTKGIDAEANVRWALENSSAASWHTGMQWYANANAECAAMARYYNLPLSTVVGVVAAISPNKRWEEYNLPDASHVIYHTLQGTNYRVPGLSAPAGWAQFDKADRILAGEDPYYVLSHTPSGKDVSWRKTPNFFLDIMYPYDVRDSVTMDTHAIAIPLGLYWTPGIDSNISKGVYLWAAKPFVSVAADYGLTPSQAQAIGWTERRDEWL